MTVPRTVSPRAACSAGGEPLPARAPKKPAGGGRARRESVCEPGYRVAAETGAEGSRCCRGREREVKKKTRRETDTFVVAATAAMTLVR